MEIRLSTESDISGMRDLHTAAFGGQEGLVIAELTADLLVDETAKPILSLVAIGHRKLLGHILFTKVTIPQSDKSVSAQILAPLAVMPDVQRMGVGKKLIAEGLRCLKDAHVQLVFVLGHPDYYPRCGFTPAGVLGLEAPYPIKGKNAPAWMVQDLSGGLLGKVKGKVQCADALSYPEHWVE